MMHRWRAGLFVAMLALLPQLVSGGMAVQPAGPITPAQNLAILLADPGAICHGDTGGKVPDRPARHGHGLDCLLCPYCATITVHAALRGDQPSLPFRRARAIVVGIADAPATTMPPSRVLAARPRGPPILG